MENKTHSPISVANYLLKKGEDLDQLKLIKLVYLCHGWCLGIFDAPLVNETVKATQYGPVFPSLYKASSNITMDPVKPPLGDGKIAKLTKQQKELVDLVFNTYHDLNGVQLMRLSHKDGTPWRRVWLKRPYEYAPIGDELIELHYKEKLHDHRDKPHAQK